MAETTTEPRPEDLLWSALREALLAPRGQAALALHLSRLAPPAPRPYHRRIAHAILEEAARRHDGSVFRLASGDAVLLCRLPGGAPPPEAAHAHPSALPHTLATLFRADLPDPSGLTTIWHLERDDEALLAYAAAARAAPPIISPATATEPAPCSRP